MKKYIAFHLVYLVFVLMTGCSDDREASLKNDLIKRTVSPLLVGERIEFAYAAGTTNGKLQTLRVTASTPGAEGTNFEPYAWRTENGSDVSQVVATDCKTEGKVSSAMITDAQATTLRYYYVIPEELKGREISFTFSSTADNGETATYSTPTYPVSAMDMRKKIELSGEEDGARYFSIADMKAYTLEEVLSGNLSSKIDFIYAYASTKNVGENSYTYNHAFFAPGAEAYYPDNFSIPTNWPALETLMDKKLFVWDGQLKDDKNNNIYIDDLDLQSQTFENSAQGILDLKVEGSLFIKSADGKQVAYIYINALNNQSKSAEIGIKKLSIN